jgi:chloramphenicol 3-O-phosphotransferase
VLLLLLILLTLPVLARDLPPVLLLLNGTGSAGKSSIGRALQKELRHSIFLSEERLVLAAYLDILREKHLQPARALHDIPELMSYRASLPARSQAGLKQAFRKRGQEFIRQETRRQVDLAARQGYDFILIDDTLWKPEQVQQWQRLALGYRAFHVVVYCPLSSLLEHVKTRNQSIYRFEHRDLALPLEMYFSMYPATNATNPIDFLEREQVARDLQECSVYQQSLTGQPADFSFYLQTSPTLKIAPFFEYDMAVNTGRNSPEECVRQICAELRSRAWLLPIQQKSPEQNRRQQGQHDQPEQKFGMHLETTLFGRQQIDPEHAAARTGHFLLAGRHFHRLHQSLALERHLTL